MDTCAHITSTHKESFKLKASGSLVRQTVKEEASVSGNNWPLLKQISDMKSGRLRNDKDAKIFTR